MDIRTFEKLDAQAAEKANRLFREREVAFQRPVLEDNELVEYAGLSDDDRVALFQKVGAQKYAEYVLHMEKLQLRKKVRS
jgi:hypothetical protein